jgi:hypothetical protein
MMRKILLKPEKEIENPVQRTVCLELLARPRIGYAR